MMRDEPLVVDIPQEQLDTPVAQVAAAELEADQDDVLAEEGIDESEKVQSYTNALNGFSAILSHDEAQRLAANPKVVADYRAGHGQGAGGRVQNGRPRGRRV